MERQEIEKLLDKYLEGETTLQEEQKLGRYFMTHTDLPPELEEYRMLFGYFEVEREKIFEKDLYLPKPKNYKRIFGSVVAVAAVLALLWLLPTNTQNTVQVSGDSNLADENTVSLFMMMGDVPRETKENLNFLGELGALNITGKTYRIQKQKEQKTDTIKPLKKEEK